MEKELSFEEALKELQQQISLLEQGNLPLEDALKIYGKAMEISGLCNKKLEMAQAEVKKIADAGEDYKLEDFEA